MVMRSTKWSHRSRYYKFDGEVELPYNLVPSSVQKSSLLFIWLGVIRGVIPGNRDY